MKTIITTIIFIILMGCGATKNVYYPSEEIKQNSFYYGGDDVTFKVDSITEAYELPTLPYYKTWNTSSHRGVHRKDSVIIETYYIILEQEKKNYIFNVIDIEKINFKEFKFLIN